MPNVPFFRSKEAETPATPDATKEFILPHVSASKSIASLETEAYIEVPFYIKSSTTGDRGVIITATYKVTENSTVHQCNLIQKLNLDTVEPFFVNSELLR